MCGDLEKNIFLKGRGAAEKVTTRADRGRRKGTDLEGNACEGQPVFGGSCEILEIIEIRRKLFSNEGCLLDI